MVEGFAALTIDEWLDDPVIPTTHKILSRRELIIAVRDQDGGAHSDTDAQLQKSIAYVELVNAFPISKQSALRVPGTEKLVWELLPPVTMPLLRQISHEMLSTIWSQSDIGQVVYLPTLVCVFNGTQLQGAFVPEEYPDLGPVHGKRPGVIQHFSEGAPELGYMWRARAILTFRAGSLVAVPKPTKSTARRHYQVSRCSPDAATASAGSENSCP